MDVLTDAFLGLEPGAITILKFMLAMRANPRTRRSPALVASMWQRFRRHPTLVRPKWWNPLLTHLLGVFRQWRKICYPMLRRSVDHRLTQQLSRRERRAVGYTGMVQVHLPTLEKQAHDAATALQDDLQNEHVVHRVTTKCMVFSSCMLPC